MQRYALFQKLWHKCCFRLRLHFALRPLLRRMFWTWQGARLGAGTRVPKVQMNWPHQVSIGQGCLLEEDICFKFDGFWKPGPSIVIGDRVFLGRNCEFNIRKSVVISEDCLIASGCKFIDHDHGMDVGFTPMNVQPCQEAAIRLESDAWLGVNSIILKGVTIGRGAVIGAGAVVTRSVPPYEIWAGIPAQKIGERRESQLKESLVEA